jgi:hypothetical protein
MMAGGNLHLPKGRAPNAESRGGVLARAFNFLPA